MIILNMLFGNSERREPVLHLALLVIIFSSDAEVIKLFSCSAQLSMKFFPLINVKMPTVVGILTFMSGKNNILGLSESKKS